MQTPEEIGLRILAAFLEEAGAKLPLPLDKVETLFEKLRSAHNQQASQAATLAGLRLKLDKKGLLTATNEGPRRRGLKN